MVRSRCVFAAAAVVAAVSLLSAGSADAATLTVCRSGCGYSSFQAALNAATPGDTILLRAGETFVGNFTLPAKGSSTAFITIRSDAADSQLPPDGVRLVPSDRSGSNTSRSLLPRLLGQGGVYKTTPVLRTAAGAHHYLLKFVEIDGSASEGYETIVRLGDDKADTAIAHDIVMDRVYVHGHRYRGQKRGITLNGQTMSVLNSYVADVKAVLTDCQAIAGYNGAGPFDIVNNFLEASAENIMFGGSGPAISQLVPADIEIRRNHLYKPLSWQKDIVAAPASPRASATTGGSLSSGTHYFRVAALMVTGARTATSVGSAQVSATVGSSGAVTLSWSGVAGADRYRIYRGTTSGRQTVYTDTSGAGTSFTYKGTGETSGTPPTTGTRWVVKNLLELKNAERVTIEGNIMENVWKAGQAGYAIMLTPRNASGTAYWSRVQDVMIANNVVRRASGAVNITGYDDSGTSGRTKRITVRNNLFYDIDPVKYGGLAKAFLLGDGPDTVTMDRNTVVHNNSAVVHGYGDPTTGFRFSNNNTIHNRYGIMGDGAQPGNYALNMYFPSAIVTCNILAGGSASAYPATNKFPSVSDWNASFAGPSTGDYSLRSGSVVAQLGCDGVAPGANFTELNGALAGTTAPDTSEDPSPTTSNEPPIAQAGGPYTAAAGAVVTVNGSASSDADGSIVTYRWTWGDEVLVRAADLPASAVHGTDWARTSVSGAAGGIAMNNPDRGTAKRDVALASPASYVEFQVRVAAGVPYKLWMRMRAAGNSVSNDSLHLQFSGAVDALGAPVARIGTTSSLPVLLEDGRGAYVSGWGWNDEDYEGMAAPVYFSQSGVQTIRIQQREDGVMWDELVLSSARYRTASPGLLKNDTNILSSTFGTSTGVTSSHTYAVSGVFPLLLTVIDDDGARASDDANVSVSGTVARLEWRAGEGRDTIGGRPPAEYGATRPKADGGLVFAVSPFTEMFTCFQCPTSYR